MLVYRLTIISGSSFGFHLVRPGARGVERRSALGGPLHPVAGPVLRPVGLRLRRPVLRREPRPKLQPQGQRSGHRARDWALLRGGRGGGDAHGGLDSSCGIGVRSFGGCVSSRVPTTKLTSRQTCHRHVDRARVIYTPLRRQEREGERETR